MRLSNGWKGGEKMRKVVMIFEVEDLKKEAELKAKVMQIAQITKARLKKIESKKIVDNSAWKYPSNIY